MRSGHRPEEGSGREGGDETSFRVAELVPYTADPAYASCCGGRERAPEDFPKIIAFFFDSPQLQVDTRLAARDQLHGNASAPRGDGKTRHRITSSQVYGARQAQQYRCLQNMLFLSGGQWIHRGVAWSRPRLS